MGTRKIFDNEQNVGNALMHSKKERINPFPTVLDIIRRHIYDCERRGIQPKIEGAIRRYDAIDFRGIKKQRDILSSSAHSADNGYGRGNSQETKSNEDDSKISYSLKGESQIEKNYITGGAKWIFADIGGTDVFAIYSTDNIKDPTVLYASKGKKAEVEKNRLLEILEEYENGKNTDRTSKASNEVFSGNWTQQAHGLAGGGNGLPGSKSGVGNATVLQGKPSANGSRAFRNVIESLFKISSEGRGGRDGISHSLKGGAAKKTGTSNVYSNRNGFDETYNSWIADGKPDRKVLVVGKTSGALKSIGVKEQGITWDTSKINKSLRKHSYLDDEILKSIPALIEYPIIVMQSKQSNSRITMFGEVYDKDGLPIMAVLELQPLKDKSGIVLDEIKIVSAHSRKNKIPTDVTQTQRMIDTSDILYIEPNKKRTDSWLMRTRLQLPFGITNYGSIKSVTYPNGNVNTYSMQNGEKDSDVSYSLKGESQIMRDYDLMKRGELSQE